MLCSSYEYGPCVGVSRLDRWERAYALGLNPPPEVRFPLRLTRIDSLHVKCMMLPQIKDILTTKEGSTDDQFSQSVFYGEV